MSAGTKYVVKRLGTNDNKSLYAVYHAEADSSKIEGDSIVIPMKLTGEAVITGEQLACLKEEGVLRMSQ